MFEPINMIIISVIAILAIILLIDWSTKRGTKRKKEFEEIVAEAHKAHWQLLALIQEEKEKDVRSLYPIGSLIPKKKDGIKHCCGVCFLKRRENENLGENFTR